MRVRRQMKRSRQAESDGLDQLPRRQKPDSPLHRRKRTCRKQRLRFYRWKLCLRLSTNFVTTIPFAGMGEAGGDRSRGKPFRRAVRAGHSAVALYAGAADAAKLRSAGGGVDARLAARIRGAGALPRRRGCGIARVQSGWPGRNRADHRPDGRISLWRIRWWHSLRAGFTKRRLTTNPHEVHAASPGLRLLPHSRRMVLFAGGLGWLAILTHSVVVAIKLGFYWFIFAEVIKVLMAAARGWTRWSRKRQSPA